MLTPEAWILQSKLTNRACSEHYLIKEQENLPLFTTTQDTGPGLLLQDFNTGHRRLGSGGTTRFSPAEGSFLPCVKSWWTMNTDSPSPHRWGTGFC